MAKAIRIERNGGPDVMQYVDVEVAAPAPDEVLLRHTAVGVNYIDVYDRTGLYPMPLPAAWAARRRGSSSRRAARSRVSARAIASRTCTRSPARMPSCATFLPRGSSRCQRGSATSRRPR